MPSFSHPRTLLILLASMAPSSSEAASTDWNAILNQNGGSAVKFGSAISGPEEFKKFFEESFAPASNSKLITAGAALDILGSDFQFTSKIRWRAVNGETIGNMELIGGGDPTWAMSEFGEAKESRLDDMAKSIRGRGIRFIQGDLSLISSDSRWDKIEFPIGWKANDTTSCEGVLAQSFNLNINCGTYLIKSATAGAWRENGVNTPVTVNLTEGATTNISISLIPNPEGQRTFLVSGTWKKGSSPQIVYLPIYSTQSWIKEEFREALLKQGISFIALQPGEVPSGPIQETLYLSPPLREILKPFLKNSINFLGDAIIKAIGAAVKEPAQKSFLELGINQIHSFLRTKIQAPEQFQIYDGSGLSRLSRVSPRVIFDLLFYLREQPDFPIIWDALPIAGFDGTLANRMKNTPAQGTLRAKTGTLDGVYNLAGYVPDDGKFVPFVILATTTTANKLVARNAQDRVGAQLATILKATPMDLSKVKPFPFDPFHSTMDLP